MKAKTLATLPTLARYLHNGIHASDWYAKANESIRAYSADTGLPVGYVADVLALVSPRKTVKDSVRIALHYFDTGKLIDVVPSVRAQFDHWQETGHIRGLKCRKFSKALLGDGNSLVVDSWIEKAIKAPFNSARRKWVYQGALRRFSRLAEVTGLTIAECQAAVWCGVQGGDCVYLEVA